MTIRPIVGVEWPDTVTGETVCELFSKMTNQPSHMQFQYNRDQEIDVTSEIGG